MAPHQPRRKIHFYPAVSGHSFSRAVSRQKKTALAAEGTRAYYESKLQRDRLRILSSVAQQTLLTSIHAQFLGAFGTQLILRQHSQHSFANHVGRPPLQHAANRHFLQSARMPAMMPVNFLVNLIAGQTNKLSVDHHNVIAAIQEWRIL